MTAVASIPTVTVKRIAALAQQIFDAWLTPLPGRMDAPLQRLRPPDIKVDARRRRIRVRDARSLGAGAPQSASTVTIEAPRRLVHLNSVHAGQDDSLVTVEFRPDGQATEVVITHARLPGTPRRTHRRLDPAP
jgi:hypothetical protein